MYIIIWLSIFAVLLVIELMTMGLYTIWFAGGALIGCLLAVCGAPLWVQIVAFVLVSGVLLFFTRPIAMKHFNKDRYKSNVEGLVGKKALVIAPINNLEGKGTVKIEGMEWTARSEGEDLIDEGKTVIVEKVDGVKLIVKEEK